MAIRDMVARHSEFEETQDMVPTPPWVTRVLYEVVEPKLKELAPSMSAWEPAAGFGHMSATMEEFGHSSVFASDKTLWLSWNGQGISQQDFTEFTGRSADLIATNPPYAELDKFIQLGLERSEQFLALLVRVQGLEGQRRYTKFYRDHAPTRVALFSDRISFKSNEVVRKAPKMFFHTWLLWDKSKMGFGRVGTELMWIAPDSQQKYEKDSDYE